MKHPTQAVLLVMALLGTACRDVSTPVSPDAGQSQALARSPAGPQTIPGQYIVVFDEAVPDPASLARALVSAHGGSLHHVYLRAIKGFSARLSDAAVAALRRNPLVGYVEVDQVVRTDETQAMDGNGDPWGLDRIDQRAQPLSSAYTYTSTGAGVHAYIIDTGIWTLHPEFGGRADNVYDALALGLLGGVTGQDCNGHGTHVAGTVGGTTYGVAKGVWLHGVRVLNCAGSGVFLAVAAGNDNADACASSPAGAVGVFTVAASERTDSKASYLNWGSCVEAYAPGSAIKSTWLLGVTMSLSGTSMAAPHVAGVAALHKATFGDAASATVAGWIINHATAGAVTGNPGSTPNLLLFKSTL